MRPAKRGEPMANVRQVMPSKAPISKEIRVAAYARVSSGKDAMLHSLSTQVSYFSQYIQSHPGWQFAGVYADEAKTGTKDDRPEFQRMIQDCRDGKIDMIITKAVSRFSRNAVTLLETTRELKALGVAVFFQKEGIYSDRSQGELVLSLLATVAQEESRAVSDNCKWRIRSRFKAGELVNLRFLYGYRIRKGQVDIMPEEAEVVTGIFKDYLAGVGCEAIAKSLRERRVSTTFGGNWTGNRVMVLLKNEKYAGNALLQKKYVTDHITKKLILNRGQLSRYYSTGTHPAIVDPVTFKQVQQKIEENRIKNNIAVKKPGVYTFTKKIQCAACGKSFRRVVYKGVPKWQCATYLREGKDACPAKQIPEAVLYTLATNVLGIEGFDAEAFDARVNRIEVVASNSVRFVMRDGHEVDMQWQDRSRSESWTEDMRTAARDRLLLKG